jgi:spermidine synthase
VSFAIALLVAALSGFIALSYEILWYRVIAFASWGLPGAFGLLLAVYLMGIAIGSRVAGAFCEDDVAYGDRRQLRALAAFAFVANAVAWLVVPFFGWSARAWSWPLGLALVGVAAALLGAILPLVSHFGIQADDRAGQRLSYVYLANIAGSAAGSLVTGFVFMDAFPIATIGAIVGATGMALVALLALLSFGGAARARGAAVAACVAAAGAALVLATPAVYDRLWERLLFKSTFTPETRFADVVETRSGVIAVTKDGSVFGGGAYDGRFNTTLSHDRNGIERAYAVAALHPAPKRLLMIGLSSGSWAAVLAGMPGLEHLTIVEINPGYLRLIAKHPEVAGILTDPKVDIVIDDGRRWLHRHPDPRFDVIVMNTTWHWRAHITNLVSREFMELARAHLAPGGVFYFNTTSSADVKKTAATSFPFALRVSNFMAVSDAPIAFDRARWQEALAAYRVGGAPAIDRSTDEGRRLFDETLALADTLCRPPVADGLETRESVLARASSAEVVTDDTMIAEWRKVFRFPTPPP